MDGKIICIGGGTGTFTLLNGLKNYTDNLVALVSMADDGGSSGKLRDEYGILPPGDIRRCLIALSDDEKAKILRELFEVRFDKIGNHNFGNLFLLALEKLTGSSALAIKEAEKILNVKGRVIPISVDNTRVSAELESGEVINGQTNVSYNSTSKIKNLFLKPEAFIYIDARKELESLTEKDKIVICPGDLYGSIIPNFLIKGVKEAVANSKARKIYVCNLVTKQGTHGFKASNFVNEIERYLGCKLDVVICNTKQPSGRVVDKYKGEDSYFVEPDLDRPGVIKEALLVEKEGGEDWILARHDAQKTARLIMGL